MNYVNVMYMQFVTLASISPSSSSAAITNGQNVAVLILVAVLLTFLSGVS